MEWKDLRTKHPNRWVLFEALEARSIDGKRIVDNISVVETFEESEEALKAYSEFHKKEPQRELYIAHTQKDDLEILERKWLGVRL